MRLRRNEEDGIRSPPTVTLPLAVIAAAVTVPVNVGFDNDGLVSVLFVKVCVDDVSTSVALPSGSVKVLFADTAPAWICA